MGYVESHDVGELVRFESSPDGTVGVRPAFPLNPDAIEATRRGVARMFEAMGIPHPDALADEMDRSARRAEQRDPKSRRRALKPARVTR